MKSYFLSLALLAGLGSLPAQAAEKIENFIEVYKQPCDSVTGESYKDDWCNPGNALGGAPNVVLVGDSYSNSAIGMLDEFTRNNTKKIIYEQYARGQCPSLLGYGPDWCSEFAKTIYERVRKTPSIQTVVLAGAWSDYWGGQKRYESTARPYLRGEFEESFVTTVKAYQSLGKKVVVMYQSPGLYDPKVCALRRFEIKEAVNKCYLSREQADGIQAYRVFMNPVLLELGVTTFDTYPYFCDAKECKLKDGDKIFTTSTAHLSSYGGQYLARKAAPELKKLFQF